MAIVTTHPIQYYAPVFQRLHQRENIAINVYYTMGEGSAANYDAGFNKYIEWDLPLLKGYPFEWVKNTASKPSTSGFNGIINPGLINQIEQWKPDAILVYGWANKSHLKIIRYFKNTIPVFFRGDSTLLDEKPGIKALLRRVFLKWVYKHISHAFYAGTNNKAYFKKYGLLDTQLSLAPHAIDNDRFKADRKTEANLLREQLGIGSDEILILFAGKFENKKDPLLLLEAFLKIGSRNTHLLFVGNGILEATLKIMAKGEYNIHFMDFQNQSYMPVIYQACDVFCLPSKGTAETWGLAVNEAMACSKTIVVSDKVGCAIDLVKPGSNGFIFRSGNLADMMNKLKSLADKNALVEMGKKSAQIIKDWSFENQLLAIENKVIGG